MKTNRALTLLFLANTVSGFTTGMSLMAILWYFNQMGASTEFNKYQSIVTVLALFWGLYAGSLIDGFRRKDVFLGTNFIESLILLTVASVGFQEDVIPTTLIVFVFASIFFVYYIHFPNLYAFAQEIADPKFYARIASYIEIIGIVPPLLAGSLGGFIIDGLNHHVVDFLGTGINFTIHVEPWELHEIFLLTGAAYIVSFILIWFIKYKPKEEKVYESQDLMKILKSGLTYLKQNPYITIFNLSSYSVLIVFLTTQFAVLPMYVGNYLEANGFIYVGSEFLHSAGSMFFIIIILTSALGNYSVTKATIVLELIVIVVFVVLSLSKSVIIFAVMMMIFGFANTGSRIFRTVFLFKHVPKELMGRISSIFLIYTTLFRVFFFINFSSSFFSEGSNIIYACMILTLFEILSLGMLVLFYKKIIKLDPKSD